MLEDGVMIFKAASFADTETPLIVLDRTRPVEEGGEPAASRRCVNTARIRAVSEAGMCVIQPSTSSDRMPQTARTLSHTLRRLESTCSMH